MNNEKIVLVGAGLAGSLLGILLAKRGYTVEIFERRPDMRKTDISAGRSINLALSNRGLRALKRIGMDEYIRKEVVPMKGRMIHLKDSTGNFQPYSARPENYINSVSRGGLNMALMTKAEEFPNLKIHFNTKCTNFNFANKSAEFENALNGVKFNISAETFIGTDGSASAIRDAMMNGGVKRFNFSQDYLDHGYKELRIPPTSDGGFQINKDALHIWPRHDYMMIGLPNFDGSFTCTLFMGFEGEQGLDNLTTNEKVIEFFKDQFPDAVPIMPSLAEDFFANPTGALATVRCFPWSVEGKALLLGDSAHAVVPFYGQGMNCSFEDCLELDDAIDEFAGNWEEIYTNYSKRRKPNTDAIASLAVENYLEMRSSVANETFVLKRLVEYELEKTYPDFNSKYSMVTFYPEFSYAEARKRGGWQDETLMQFCSNYKDISEINLDEVYKLMKTYNQ